MNELMVTVILSQVLLNELNCSLFPTDTIRKGNALFMTLLNQIYIN